MASRYPTPEPALDAAEWAKPRAPAVAQHDSSSTVSAYPAPFTHEGANLAAVDFPLGGFGAGHLTVGGDGTLQQFCIVNQVRSETLPKACMPASFFAISANDGTGEQSFVLSAPTTYTATNRALPPGKPARVEPAQVARLQALPGIKAITLVGRYPVAELAYEIVGFPATVAMEATTPLIPTAVKESSLPSAIFTFTLTNPSTTKSVAVRVMEAQQNFVGWDGQADCTTAAGEAMWGGNVNTPHATGISLSNPSLASTNENGGSLAVSAMVSPSTGVSSASVTVLTQAASEADIFAQFVAKKDVAPSAAVPSTASAAKASWVGGVVGAVTLEPGATATITFVLAWHFPNRSTARSAGSSYVSAGILPAVIGNRYNSWFSDANAVANYTIVNLARLLAGTRLYRDTLFASTMPPELLGCASSKVAHLRCPTMWWTENGVVMGCEGNGCCPLNCTHVYGYTTLMERLFPSLAKDMRVSDFVRNYGRGGCEQGCTMRFGRGGWAIDGALACIIKTYLVVRQNDPHATWLATVWKNVKDQMSYIMKTFDCDGDGVIYSHDPNPKQQNTYDTAMSGANTFIGSYYVTALKAVSKMAALMGETDYAATLAARAVMSATNYEKVCWNNDFGYYVNIVSLKNCANSYGPGCFCDQLCSVGLSTACGLGPIFDPDHVALAHKAIIAHNRVTCPPMKDMQKHLFDGDVAIVCCTYPHGKLGAGMRYDTIVSTGFTSPNIAGMLFDRNVADARSIAGWICDRQDGRNRSPWNEPECNLLYSRAMAHWNIFDQAAGFNYDSANGGALEYDPRVFDTGAYKSGVNANFKCFTILDGGWGEFTQAGPSGLPSGSVTLTCLYGTMSLLSLKLATSATAIACTCTGGGGGPYKIAGGVITFTTPLTFAVGDVLKITLSGGPALASVAIAAASAACCDSECECHSAAAVTAKIAEDAMVSGPRARCLGMSRPALLLVTCVLVAVLAIAAAFNFTLGAVFGVLGKDRIEAIFERFTK